MRVENLSPEHPVVITIKMTTSEKNALLAWILHHTQRDYVFYEPNFNADQKLQHNLASQLYAELLKT